MRNTLPLYHFISTGIDTSLLKLEGCWHHDLTISAFWKVDDADAAAELEVCCKDCYDVYISLEFDSLRIRE